ncbi:MAG: hypothetical protein ACOYKM_14665 [Caulobacterales bacterium]
MSEQLASSGNPPGFSNLREAVWYALLGRPAENDGSDLYSLLRYESRRYLVVDPGSEWAAVMVSLLAGPGGHTTVRDLVNDLRLLGLRVSLPEVLQDVERSGLAELAADADLAVTLRSAF